MANRAQKPAELLADKRPGRRQAKVLELRPNTKEPPPMPRLPAGRPLVATRELWNRFWRSPIAQVVQLESDWPRLERWIVYNDEWFRAMRGLQKARLVIGSTGRPMMNPMAAYVMKLERQLAAVEEKFGLTPLDRMRLGISFGEARRSLADLNEELSEDDDGAYELPEGYKPVEEEAS